MKQYVTQQERNELSNTSLRRLIEWQFSKGYDGKDLSIGQMIEFMEDNRTMMGIKWYLDEEKRCDRLWEMVKKILEKK